jgi:catechol 2,3-dioxygenase-like lactoylglutathione lyase family enzyme
MISHLSHTTIFVKNQDSARDFYTTKLGFAVETDTWLGSTRWLTVRAPEQKDLVIALLDPATMFDDTPDVADKIRDLQATGRLGAGVFHTSDCRRTYEKLKIEGVKFRQPPDQRPYGIEAIFEDDSGNWFSLTQPQSM